MNDEIEIREAEPDSYGQFIVGRDHAEHGRARHPFMTGSGGWSYFSATRYMLGIRPDYDELIIDPCIPDSWDGFSATRCWRGAVYEIEVKNPDHVEKGVRRIVFDGEETDRIPACASGTTHKVEVVMG